MKEFLSDLRFRLMAWHLRRRERPEFTDPVLAEAGVAPGMTVLDFGCGPGAFTFAAARLVGPAGRVCAVDRHPLAVRMVKEKAIARGVTNVCTVLSDRGTGHEGGFFDRILFYDLLHLIGRPEPIFAEFRRVLAPTGVLSVTDHHMKSPDIRRVVEAGGLFRFVGEGDRSLSFAPAPETE